MYTRGAKVVYFINCQLGDCYQSPVHQNQNPFLTVLLIPFFFSISHFKSCCNVRPPCVGLLAVQEGMAFKVPAIQVPCHIVKVILCENLRRFLVCFVIWTTFDKSSVFSFEKRTQGPVELS